MLIEGMVVVGVGFTALCGYSGSGEIDKIAEANGWQEKGELEKWKGKNIFKMEDLIDLNDFIEDLKEEVGMQTKVEEAKAEAAAEQEATDKAEEAKDAPKDSATQ
mmetsp:Transcript_63501/g.149483  ORF Transcript_63501/g.149483 Transcript_63501/m.149483 type:complete len:105 (-) Transcript_63501:42-356(-)